ncbi:hypothetical protein NliqN6_2719 [Naganishia liquefaciens]|uniref:Cell division control protein 45 n=1 Tax=Naganishia liquefaciens TaxID=104408 RepID=A0A8H3TSE8_9TREE|nr:hypothetical protein NliqN6_2719 [Naganishia liquefaciens]
MPLIVPPASNLSSSTLTYLQAWNTILKRVRVNPNRSAGGLVIFAAIDLDALLASRILVNLLRQEDIPYTLIPISGYSELEARKNQIFGIDPDADEDEQTVSQDCEVHTLILISLGSLLPIASYFPLESGCHIHLIDAHRPYNLDNLFGNGVNDGRGDDAGVAAFFRNSSRQSEEDGDQEAQFGRIWVWTDGEDSKLTNVKTSWEKLEYEPDSDDSSADSSSSDSETEDEDNDEDEDAEDEDGSATELEDEDGVPRQRGSKRKNGKQSEPGKRKKGRKSDDQDKPRRLTTAARRLHAERVQKYYHAGTSFGLSVAECCYLLASELERGDNDLLWYAILGLTHQYVTSRIDRDEYDERHDLYIDEVARLNAPQTTGTGTGLLPTGDPDNMMISESEELRFVLFRHWNLYDAMLHSGYVAGRLGVWRDKGRKQLTGLLAKMGYSLRQCQQSYSHMDISLKSSLREQLEAIAPEYGLVESTYPSFTRAFGYRCPQLSAADTVEGLCALLEAATGVRIEVEQDGGKGGGEWFGGTKIWSTGVGVTSRSSAAKDVGRSSTQNEADEMEKNDKLEQKQSERNFWICYDALQEVTFLRKSLGLAKALHVAIIRQGTSILDKNAIKPLRTFRFVAIREGPDLRIFSHASTLSRLAIWLMDATRDKITRIATAKKKAPVHPMVVACLNEDKGTYLIVGFTGAPEFGDVRKNRFGLAFQTAAEESGAAARHDRFDTSIVEVRKDDLTSFIECLHLRSAT